MKKWIGLITLLLLGIFILTGCNLPTADGTAQNGLEDDSEAAAPDPVENNTGSDNVTTPGELTPDAGKSESTRTPQPSPTPKKPTATPEDEVADGDDLAEFITDVTVPDYSEIETGEEITKTWRIKNAGTTTWTTSYLLEFTKGEKLGANTQIPLPKEVKPGEMVDLSIKFTAPTATGEYSSYWIIKNEENKRIGTTGEGEFFELYMIVKAIQADAGGDGGDGGSSGGSSIAGGAKVSGVTVTVSPTTYNGSCPANIDIDYTVTTANAGKVKFNLVFNVISPSGFSFDPPPQYEVPFTGGYTVYYDYLFLPTNSVTATVRVRAIGSNEVLSAPVQFTVKCD